MRVEDATELVVSRLPRDYARFYGPAEGVGLGAGLIYSGVLFPVFDPSTNIYLTQRGLVYVLTHECDVDQANVRPFNDDVLICPIINFVHFITLFSRAYRDHDLRAYLGNLASRYISQLIYLPLIPDVLPFGGVLFLNQIGHTKLQVFEQLPAQCITTVSAFGLNFIDLALVNHLRREKADRLPFTV